MEREKNGGLGAVVGLFWVSDSKEKKGRCCEKKKNTVRTAGAGKDVWGGLGKKGKQKKTRPNHGLWMPWMGWFWFVLFYFLMGESKLILSGAHTSKLPLLHLICLTQRGGDYGVALVLIGLMPVLLRLSNHEDVQAPVELASGA